MSEPGNPIAKFFSSMLSQGKIPTVKFDASQVTKAVKADLVKNIKALEDIDSKFFDQIYDAALRSITIGRDLHVLDNAIMQANIDGMTKERAAQIARLLSNKATSFMQRQRMLSSGIKQVIWLYSGAPCTLYSIEPTGGAESRQNAAHKAANGKTFDVAKGMYLDGKWTWPGVEPECKCVMKPVVKGFS